MRNPIIDTFLERGHITKEAAARLEDFDDMVKEGFEMGDIWKRIRDAAVIAKDIVLKSAPALVTVGIAGAAAHQIKKQYTKHLNIQLGNNIGVSRKMLQEQHPVFQSDPERATSLFNEVANLAPNVASKPNIAGKIIKKYIDTGLDYDAVYSLMKLDQATSQTKVLNKPEPPNLAAISASFITPVAGDIMSHLQSGSAPQTPSGPTSQQIIQGAAEMDPEMLRGLMPKRASYNSGISINTLATLYPFIKQAGFFSELGKKFNKLDPRWAQPLAVIGGISALKGLGSLAVAGGQKLYEKHHTEELKKDLLDSWARTIGRLQAQSSKGAYFTSGVDYNSPEVMEQAQQAFNTLATISPSVALDPLSAATFVNKAIQNDSQIEPELLKTVSEIQKNIVHLQNVDEPAFGNSLIGRHFQSAYGAGPDSGDTARFLFGHGQSLDTASQHASKAISDRSNTLWDQSHKADMLAMKGKEMALKRRELKLKYP